MFCHKHYYTTPLTDSSINDKHINRGKQKQQRKYNLCFNKDYVCNTIILADFCGGKFTSEYGTITSPGYPEIYRHNLNCVWRIAVNNAVNVKLRLDDLYTEEDEHCRYDFLAVYDGEHTDNFNLIER